MKFSHVIVAVAAAATSASASPLTVGGSTSLTGLAGILTGQITQLTSLAQLPTCAITCVNAAAQKAGTGSLSLLQLGTLCNNVTGVLNGAAVCLQTTCKLPTGKSFSSPCSCFWSSRASYGKGK
jgi:hypothetical protein